MTLFAVLLLVSVSGFAILSLAAARVMSEAPRGAIVSAPVSILKPLKGAEADLEENLRSFYRLDYPEFEIIFSFASPTDTAVDVARRVADAHPAIATAFVFDSREPGANPKVSRLLHAMTRARFPLLLISDGDVRVRPEFLRETVAELSDPATGLVSNPFRGVAAGTLGSRIEALHFNGFVFGGTAAVSRVLRRPCVVGKSILLRRDVLEWIGGFEAVKDFLAEDYLLGEIVAKAGFHVVLSRHVITVTSRGRSIAQFWDRQVRWARMRRRLGGPAYGAEAFSSPIPWAIPMLFSHDAPWAAGLILAKLAADLVLLGRLGVPRRFSDLAAIVLKDLLVFGVFWAALASNRTRWRGKEVSIGARTLLRA